MAAMPMQLAVFLLAVAIMAAAAGAEAARPAPRIVGGSQVQLDSQDFLWAASLHETNGEGPNEQNAVCAGSLIAPDWILTAAHCISYRSPIDYAIVGTVALNGTGSTDMVKLKVKRMFRNQGFGNNYNNDVALLKLEEPVNSIKPIKLTKKERNPGTMLAVAGWGTVEPGILGSPGVLHVAKVPLVKFKTCARAYNAEGEIFVHKGSDVCAGYKEGGKDSCQGDSGGPLFHTTRDGKQTLVGVTSRGIGCGLKNKYGIYASVAHHRAWIEEMMKYSQSTRFTHAPTGSPTSMLQGVRTNEDSFCSDFTKASKCNEHPSRCVWVGSDAAAHGGQKCASVLGVHPLFSRTPTASPTPPIDCSQFLDKSACSEEYRCEWTDKRCTLFVDWSYNTYYDPYESYISSWYHYTPWHRARVAHHMQAPDML